jgi:hypothetical protein
MSDIFDTYKGKAYRYIAFDGLFKTIENESLRLTRVDQFNDPLDNSPFLAPFDWREWKTYGNNYIKSAEHYIFSYASSSMYICCFCKEYKTQDSYLMWSHYGKSHSQVCFEIDFNKHNYLGSPSVVKYPKNLVKERNKLDIKTSDKLGLFVVTNKLRNWSYEKEVRLIVDKVHPKVDSPGFKSSDDGKYLYAKFDLNNISKVIFGIKSEKSNELKTIELFNIKKLKPKYEKMYIDPENLTLQSEPYKF